MGDKKIKTNYIQAAECVRFCKSLPDNSVDFILTSPPYEDLRDYDDHHIFDFDNLAKEMLRILKDGAMIVWVVGDKKRKWNRSLSHIRQAIRFQELGFKIPDIMIYKKDGGPPQGHFYEPCYEFMIVALKGAEPKTLNLLKRQNLWAGQVKKSKHRRKDGVREHRKNPGATLDEGVRYNIWEYGAGWNKTSTDRIAFEHPAMFPEALAQDMILSFSNEGDIVFDPFMGSGTTAKMAILNNRQYIGCDISKNYVELAEKRINGYKNRLI